MAKNSRSFRLSAILIAGYAILICSGATVCAERQGWQSQKVDWRMTGGERVTAVNFPKQNPAPIHTKQHKRKIPTIRKKLLPPEAASRLAPTIQPATAPIVAIVIDSPPINGFVPWVVIAITDERSETLVLDAIPETAIVGNYPAANPQTDYAIGVFDTGASGHVMGNTNATLAGLFTTPSMMTTNSIDIFGVTGSVSAWISQPLGLFIDGLACLEPNAVLLDTSGMVGETNTAIAIGKAQVDLPDLLTAIGTPLSIFFATHIRNDYQITTVRDSNEFTGPHLRFFDLSDPSIPTYSNIMPLELRPLGGVLVQYIISLNDLSFSPASPSVIIGNSSQSLFFVHSVDLVEGNNSAIDKDRFMFDTGAQLSVIGSRIAARLALDPASPEFEVEIQGVTGETTIAPGFYIDSVQIPALGEWLSFTDTPMILLDIASPEGGTLDGIIGMNLFVEFNFVLRGGGLFGEDDPTIEFELASHPIADVAPNGGDGVVDFLDLAAFIQAWLAIANPLSANWNPNCDIAPQPTPDGQIDSLDFAIFAEYWLQTITQ